MTNPDLPVYESNATPEQRREAFARMADQVRLIVDQESLGIPSRNVKIRCGCMKLVQWRYMYRCLYCGLWFCKECAEQHFGAKAPEPFQWVTTEPLAARVEKLEKHNATLCLQIAEITRERDELMWRLEGK